MREASWRWVEAGSGVMVEKREGVCVRRAESKTSEEWEEGRTKGGRVTKRGDDCASVCVCVCV